MTITIRHLEGPLSGQSQRFDDSFDEILFGRSEDADVVYPPECEVVGRRHLKVKQTKFGHYSVETLEHHYVEIEGIRIEKDAVIRSGTTLRLGTGGPSFQVDINQTLRTPSVLPMKVKTLSSSQKSVSSAELATKPDMHRHEEILASNRRIINEDQSAALQSSFETDRRIIDEIASVSMGNAAVNSEDDTFDLNEELSGDSPQEKRGTASERASEEGAKSAVLASWMRETATPDRESELVLYQMENPECFHFDIEPGALGIEALLAKRAIAAAVPVGLPNHLTQQSWELNASHSYRELGEYGPSDAGPSIAPYLDSKSESGSSKGLMLTAAPRPVAIGVIAIRPPIIDRWRRRRGYIGRRRCERTAHDGSNTEPRQTGTHSGSISRLRWSWQNQRGHPYCTGNGSKSRLVHCMHPETAPTNEKGYSAA